MPNSRCRIYLDKADSVFFWGEDLLVETRIAVQCRLLVHSRWESAFFCGEGLLVDAKIAVHVTIRLQAGNEAEWRSLIPL
jgi:hypothetical protein